MPEHNLKEYAERNDTDFGYEIQGVARFRANVFTDRKGPGGVFQGHSDQDHDRGAARSFERGPPLLPASQGAGAGHGPDGVG